MRLWMENLCLWFYIIRGILNIIYREDFWEEESIDMRQAGESNSTAKMSIELKFPIISNFYSTP